MSDKMSHLPRIELFDTLMVFIKSFNLKADVEENSDDKKACKSTQHTMS